ncbi:MAG: sulfatase [Verrucomicrobiae bacterium]|nr:sulfatase [Verrucomicrobiae bacterium]
MKYSWLPVCLLSLFSVLVFTGCGPSESRSSSDGRPNIIFIMSDDHAYQAVSAYGYGLNDTPNIDRLAKEGVLFTQASVTNSICAPSRAVMLTGKHSFANGKVDNLQPFNWDQDNLAKLLQKAGYTTALVGKIHLNGLPQGFNYSNVLPGQGIYYNPDFIENGEEKQYHGYVTTITTDIALDWLKNKRNKDKPFFLMYHQKAPHRTWMPEEKYFRLFDDKHFELPKNFWDDYKGRPAAANQEMEIYRDMDVAYDLKMLDKAGDIQTKYREYAQRNYDRMDAEQKAAWDAYYDPLIQEYKSAHLEGEALAEWKYNRYIQDYLRSIQSVDDGVGRVLDYLDKNGLTENTIVVYTSDQGFYLGEHGWFDKRFMYEESFRTPLLMRFPKEIDANQKLDTLVQNLDFAPTFLDYAEADIPAELQGESFRKVAAGDSNVFRDYAYYTYYEYPAEHSVMRHYGLRTDRYKLIHFYHDMNFWELYDLEEDPSEMHNVYSDPRYAVVRAALEKKLAEVREHYGDSDKLDQEHLQRYLDWSASRER